ncbi:MAG: hypothetical protein IPI44_18410 [Sulfuritalea sp.]|nr:hypothetical protein [Sulfuritalea sp.]
MHVWGKSTTDIALSVHLVMPCGHPGDAFLANLAHELHDRFEITHPMIQIELDVLITAAPNPLVTTHEYASSAPPGQLPADRRDLRLGWPVAVMGTGASPRRRCISPINCRCWQGWPGRCNGSNPVLSVLISIPGCCAG